MLPWGPPKNGAKQPQNYNCKPKQDVCYSIGGLTCVLKLSIYTFEGKGGTEYLLVLAHTTSDKNEPGMGIATSWEGQGELGTGRG